MATARSGAASPDDEAADVERAMAALEGQRAVLGDGVVDTALGPLRRRIDELRSGIEQRRMVTVLFADLVDFTAMSEQLDAEDVRVVIDRYFDRWLGVVTAHGGEVEKFIGDAVMAVFGLRRSYEDDAQRAVRAALAMQAELSELDTALDAEFGVRLTARVGVDTGDVVVSTLGDRDGAEFVVVGPTVNRASRLQAAAPPGGVLVSAETFRLVRASFAADPLPGLRLKGIEGPVDGHLVRSRIGSGFRLERPAPVEGVATTTVGRQDAARTLRAALDQTVESRTFRLLTVVGEPGIGKTRLLFDFDTWLLQRRGDDVRWFRGRTNPATRSTVGALLRDVLSARLGVRFDDDRALVRRRFDEAFTEVLGPDDGPGSARLVAAWLRFVPPTGDVPTDPQALRDRGTAALARYFAALARRGAVVLLLEDLHWADDESLRWLDAAAALLQDEALLVIASTRPDLLAARPAWGRSAHEQLLPLDALSERESRSLLDQLLARVSDPPERLLRTLLEAGEGNPFYLEELVGWLVDAGIIVRDEPHWRIDEARGAALTVPPTLRGVLQSRLDALTLDERTALQRASVVGRVFWDAAIEHLDDRARGSATALDALAAREVVLRRETSRFGDAREFVFKHALLRDVAYDGVLRRSRERYHRAAARWFEETSARAGRAEEYAAVIAAHLERARDPRAAAWYVRAAAQAAAVHALGAAGELLDAAERCGAPDDLATRVEAGLAREALLERAGDRDGQRRVLDDLAALDDGTDPGRRARRLLAAARWSFIQSDYDPAMAQAQEAADAAATAGRRELHAEALLLLGKSRTWLDDVVPARALLLRAVEDGQAAGAAWTVAEGRRYLGILDGNVGDFPPALEHLATARREFAAIGDAEMEAMAHAQSATLLYKMGRFADAQSVLEETVPIFRRAGHRYREVMAVSNLASIAVQRDAHAVAVRSAEAALTELRTMGDREAVAVTLLTLGIARAMTGGDAAPALEEAVRIADELDNAMLRADARSRSSALALLRGDLAGARRWAAAAVDVASGAPSAVDRAAARIQLGHAALAAGDRPTAASAYSAASAELEAIDTPGPAREAAIGAAAASLEDDGVGAGRVAALLDDLATDGFAGMLLPGVTLLQAVEVLERAAHPRAGEATVIAQHYLREAAERVGDADLAAGFLALPPHAALLARFRSGMDQGIRHGPRHAGSPDA